MSLDVRRSDDRPPFVNFRLMEDAQCLRRLLVARRDFESEILQTFADRRIGKGLHDRRVESHHDLLRGVLWNPERVPDRHVEAWHPRLVDRRNTDRGGKASPRGDRVGANLSSTDVCERALAVAFLSLSTSAILLPQTTARAPIVVAIAVWGVSAWAFFPAQQARLISIAGVKVAPVALSLNASFQFFGFSTGAALGSLTLANASPLALGWVGASSVLAALSLAALTRRRGRILRVSCERTVTKSV